MKYSDAFPSRYMRADDLQGTDRIVTIASVDFEDFTDPKTRRTETKPVLRFREKAAKDLVLNRTNFKIISQLLGEETDDWAGQQIVLYTTRVESFGEMVGINGKVFNSVDALMRDTQPQYSQELDASTAKNGAVDAVDALMPPPGANRKRPGRRFRRRR